MILDVLESLRRSRLKRPLVPTRLGKVGTPTLCQTVDPQDGDLAKLPSRVNTVCSSSRLLSGDTYSLLLLWAEGPGFLLYFSDGILFIGKYHFLLNFQKKRKLHQCMKFRPLFHRTAMFLTLVSSRLRLSGQEGTSVDHPLDHSRPYLVTNRSFYSQGGFRRVIKHHVISD